MTAPIIVCYNEDNKNTVGRTYENNNKKYSGRMQFINYIGVTCLEWETQSHFRGDKRTDTGDSEKNELQAQSQCGGIGQREDKNNWSYHYRYREYVFV